MPKKWYDRKGKRLIQRNWSKIVSYWQNYIPRIDTPGELPQSGIRDSRTLGEELRKVDRNCPYRDVDYALDLLRPLVLHEGVIHLYKGVNVLAGSQVHVQSGLRTWSVSGSYHAAFFAMKSVLHYLGIVLDQHVDGNYMLDVWSDPLVQAGRVKTEPLRRIRLFRTPLAEHRYVWALFQIVLGKTNIASRILSPQNAEAIRTLEITEFARQRNNLHYRISWLFDDLHTFAVDNAFGKFTGSDLNDGTALQDSNRDDFSLALAFILIRMAAQMLKDIGKKSPVVQTEYDLLLSTLSHEFGYLYQQAFPRQPIAQTRP